LTGKGRRGGGTKKVNPDLASLLWGSIRPRLSSLSSQIGKKSHEISDHSDAIDG